MRKATFWAFFSSPIRQQLWRRRCYYYYILLLLSLLWVLLVPYSLCSSNRRSRSSGTGFPPIQYASTHDTQVPPTLKASALFASCLVPPLVAFHHSHVGYIIYIYIYCLLFFRRFSYSLPLLQYTQTRIHRLWIYKYCATWQNTCLRMKGEVASLYVHFRCMYASLIDDDDLYCDINYEILVTSMCLFLSICLFSIRTQSNKSMEYRFKEKNSAN